MEFPFNFSLLIPVFNQSQLLIILPLKFLGLATLEIDNLVLWTLYVFLPPSFLPSSFPFSSLHSSFLSIPCGTTLVSLTLEPISCHTVLYLTSITIYFLPQKSWSWLTFINSGLCFISISKTFPNNIERKNFSRCVKNFRHVRGQLSWKLWKLCSQVLLPARLTNRVWIYFSP